MPWWAWTLLGVYLFGFIFMLWLNLASGPVTLGLAFMRALVWPIFLATGWPQGTRFPMD